MCSLVPQNVLCFQKSVSYTEEREVEEMTVVCGGRVCGSMWKTAMEGGEDTSYMP